MMKMPQDCVGLVAVDACAPGIEAACAPGAFKTTVHGMIGANGCLTRVDICAQKAEDRDALWRDVSD